MKSNQTKKISGGSILHGYEGSTDGRVKMVVVELGKDYPVKGWARNVDRTEAIYILEGKAILLKEGNKLELEEGEVAYMEEGKKYQVKGKARILVAIAPYDKGEIVVE
jgi:quercetin dioxygenase-like cupin family protein